MAEGHLRLCEEKRAFCRNSFRCVYCTCSQMDYEGGGCYNSCMSQGRFCVFLYPVLCVGRPLLISAFAVLHGRVISMP